MPKLKTAALAAAALILSACGATSTPGTAGQLTTTSESTTTTSTTPESTTFAPSSTSSSTEDSTSVPTTPHETTTAKPAVDHQRIALDRVGGGQVTKVERELEHGRTEWKYRILHKGVTYEVRVDAATGVITRFETK